MKKKKPFVPVGNTNRDKRVRHPRGAGSTFCPGCQTRDRPVVPGWEPGTIRISQLGQISVSIVVLAFLDIIARTPRPAISCVTSFSKLLWIPSVQQATTPLVNTVLTCYFDPKTFKMQFVCVLFLKNKSCGCRFS